MLVTHRRIIEAPRPAAAVALALQGTDGWISGRHFGAQIIIARPVEAGLRVKGLNTRKAQDDKGGGNRHAKAHA